MKAISHYRLESEVGSGVFAKVFKCRDTETSEYLACKMIKRAGMSRRTKKNLENEI
jgi:serine/threonine protein kinase